jgi:hypothetical protein
MRIQKCISGGCYSGQVTKSSGFRISGPPCAVRRLSLVNRLRRSLRAVGVSRGARPLSAFPPRETHWLRLALDLHGVGSFLGEPGCERWDLWRLINVRNALRGLPREQEQLLRCNAEGHRERLQLYGLDLLKQALGCGADKPRQRGNGLLFKCVYCCALSVTHGRNRVVRDSERSGDLADANSLAEELDNGSVYVRALRKKALARELAPSFCTRQRIQNLL